MFEEIKYRWRLQKLEKEHNKIDKEFEKRKKGLSGEDLENLRGEMGSEFFPISDQMDAIKTKRLRQKANRLMVLLPESNNDEFWRDSYYAVGKVLTDRGFLKVRKLFRQERREMCAFVIGIIGAITGLIAVLTGLITVLIR